MFGLQYNKPGPTAKKSNFFLAHKYSIALLSADINCPPNESMFLTVLGGDRTQAHITADPTDWAAVVISVTHSNFIL